MEQIVILVIVGLTAIASFFLGYASALIGVYFKKEDKEEDKKKRTYTRDELTFGYGYGDGGSDCLY